MTSAFSHRNPAAILSLASIFFVVSLLFSAPAFPAKEAITDYRSIFKPCYSSTGELRLAIRRYAIAGRTHVLLVNPETFETSVAPISSLNVFGAPVDAAQIRATPFDRALTRYTSPPCRLQNHGAVRAELPADGVFLTVDLCPSRRPFEKHFFGAAGDLSRQDVRATPLAIAMTGNWLENHQEELTWLKQEVERGRLSITWVNHSTTHPYDQKAPLERNFLLSPGVDFEREVFATEKLMLENGLVPSPFFRFPGLVADGRLLEKLRRLSLIPIGSDAWLAKGEVPKKGSFILVHGNGNEPGGITRVLPLLRGEEFRLLPLREAFTPTSKGKAGLGKE